MVTVMMMMLVLMVIVICYGDCTAKVIVSLYFSTKALQTILVLNGPQDLYKRWVDKSKDFSVDWSVDSAKEVLEAWQRSFTKVDCN